MSGAVAQLGERCVRNAKVASSILVGSTRFHDQTGTNVPVFYFVLYTEKAKDGGLFFLNQRLGSSVQHRQTEIYTAAKEKDTSEVKYPFYP